MKLLCCAAYGLQVHLCGAWVATLLPPIPLHPLPSLPASTQNLTQVNQTSPTWSPSALYVPPPLSSFPLLWESFYVLRLFDCAQNQKRGWISSDWGNRVFVVFDMLLMFVILQWWYVLCVCIVSLSLSLSLSLRLIRSYLFYCCWFFAWVTCVLYYVSFHTCLLCNNIFFISVKSISVQRAQDLLDFRHWGITERYICTKFLVLVCSRAWHTKYESAVGERQVKVKSIYSLISFTFILLCSWYGLGSDCRQTINQELDAVC